MTLASSSHLYLFSYWLLFIFARFFKILLLRWINTIDLRLKNWLWNACELCLVCVIWMSLLYMVITILFPFYEPHTMRQFHWDDFNIVGNLKVSGINLMHIGLMKNIWIVIYYQVAKNTLFRGDMAPKLA